MTTGDPMDYNTKGIPTYLSGYYQVLDEFTEFDPFKRLIAWKGLKIRSISILGNTINIECYKGKKTYFVTVDENFVKVFNNNKECIDTVPIPKVYKYQPTTTTTTPDNTWVYRTDHTTTTSNPKWTTTSNSTAAGYKISFE